MAVSKLFIFCLVLTAVLGKGILQDYAADQQLLKPTDILRWEAPKSVKSKFQYYLSGFDYDDKPVIVLEMGRWDFQGVAEKGGEDLEIANLFVDQINARILSGFFTKNLNASERIDDEVVVLVDFDGLNLSQFSSAPTFKWMLERVAKMGVVYRSLSYGFIVNANPLVSQLINTVKPFIANFLEKVEIYGTNPRVYLPQILKKIPRSELHVAYGGSKDFRPIAVYG